MSCVDADKLKKILKKLRDDLEEPSPLKEPLEAAGIPKDGLNMALHVIEELEQDSMSFDDMLQASRGVV